jgi:hypothetical protein
VARIRTGSLLGVLIVVEKMRIFFLSVFLEQIVQLRILGLNLKHIGKVLLYLFLKNNFWFFLKLVFKRIFSGNLSRSLFDFISFLFWHFFDDLDIFDLFNKNFFDNFLNNIDILDSLNRDLFDYHFLNGNFSDDLLLHLNLFDYLPYCLNGNFFDHFNIFDHFDLFDCFRRLKVNLNLLVGQLFY